MKDRDPDMVLIYVWIVLAAFCLGVVFGIEFMSSEICPLRASPEKCEGVSC